MDFQTLKTSVEPSVEVEPMMHLNPLKVCVRRQSEPPPDTNMVRSSRSLLQEESNAKTSYKMPDFSDPNVFKAYHEVLISDFMVATNSIKNEQVDIKDGSDYATPNTNLPNDAAGQNATFSASEAGPNANTAATRASRTYLPRKSLPPKRKGQEWNNVKKDIEKQEKKLGNYRLSIAKKVIWDHGGSTWRKIMVKQEGLNANTAYPAPKKDTRGGGGKLRSLALTASEDEKKAHAKLIWDFGKELLLRCIGTPRGKMGCSIKHQLLRTQINDFWYNKGIARARSDGCSQQFMALDPTRVDIELAEFGKHNQNVYKA